MAACDNTPTVTPSRLQQLWFQAGGTRCNLACTHCFLDCNPHNTSFEFLSLDAVRQWLAEAQTLGVEEFYFTGGEPMLNPEIVPILAESLAVGPTTVLTNGTVLRAEWLDRLAHVSAETGHAMEFRVSIDGFSAKTNDAIRGEGAFDRTMRGVRLLVKHGVRPIITATRTWCDRTDCQVTGQFLDMLEKAGYERPRLKILPALLLGAETRRNRPYTDCQRVSAEMMAQFDTTTLLCEHARAVTDRGVHVCPILVESPDSLLGQTLAEAMVPFPLAHGACLTCLRHGAICSNESGCASEIGQKSVQDSGCCGNLDVNTQ